MSKGLFSASVAGAAGSFDGGRAGEKWCVRGGFRLTERCFCGLPERVCTQAHRALFRLSERGRQAELGFFR